jgi:flavin-dependent dehydrogenase
MQCDVAIAGGGLSGLVAAIHLARRGKQVVVLEKKSYPFHRVCGEYVSNEVLGYLKTLSVDPFPWGAQPISEFELTSVNGKSICMPLDLGGFGISRFKLDFELAQAARQAGVTVVENCAVEQIDFNEGLFRLKAGTTDCHARVVMAAFGKRSKLDYTLQRRFVTARSPYVGVKYHLRNHHPAHRISLHNFNNGYAGISAVEGGVKNFCYLTHRNNLRTHGSIDAMERAVLHRNPFLRQVLTQSEFVFAKPEVINEITFEKKEPVYRHMLMLGDAAGMITPLCGNGMAMAIHSAKLACEAVLAWNGNESARNRMEQTYHTRWHEALSRRLWAGRQIQRLFGGEVASNFAVTLAQYAPPVVRFLMAQTHGRPF